jgi:hypothetical protein
MQGGVSSSCFYYRPQDLSLSQPRTSAQVRAVWQRLVADLAAAKLLRLDASRRLPAGKLQAGLATVAHLVCCDDAARAGAARVAGEGAGVTAAALVAGEGTGGTGRGKGVVARLRREDRGREHIVSVCARTRSVLLGAVLSHGMSAAA